MTEKKSLNFDFLDVAPQKTDVKTSANLKSENSSENIASAVDPDKLTLIQYFKKCYTNFSIFSEKYLTKKNPKYLFIAILLYGMGSVAGRVTEEDSTSWGEIWIGVLIGGLISGFLSYYIVGTIYQWRIKWSKGRDDLDTSRNISLFSSLPIATASILSLFFNQLAYGNDYLSSYNSDSSSIDLIFGLISIAAIVYSIRISYKAAREVLQAEKRRAIGWFIVAPTIFYVVIFVFAAAAA